MCRRIRSCLAASATGRRPIHPAALAPVDTSVSTGNVSRSHITLSSAPHSWHGAATTPSRSSSSRNSGVQVTGAATEPEPGRWAWPPIVSWLSRISTRAPGWRRSHSWAALTPLSPAPTTTRS
ncbi:hypothetical protein ACFQE7_24415 [Nonomuraea ferruginea]|uniref:hypothetical protein n=1 Tax=Nonomuraea ferruginea TaxID=46174 RepID=UPI003610A346